MPSRTLNCATDFFARRVLGFCPAIVASCSSAFSNMPRSCLASPTPMLSVILVILGTCMTEL